MKPLKLRDGTLGQAGGIGAFCGLLMLPEGTIGLYIMAIGIVLTGINLVYWLLDF